MAVFSISHNITKEHEGGYNAAYGGAFGSGETYKGIDRKFTKDWPGWVLIDRYKAKYGVPKSEAIIPDPQLDKLVADYIQVKYWDKSGAGQLLNQSLANFYFDFYFHKPAVAIDAVNFLVKSIAPKAIITTGTLSKDALMVMNINAAAIYLNLYKLRVLHYNGGYLNTKYNLNYKSSKKGLLNRVAKFPPTIA